MKRNTKNKLKKNEIKNNTKTNEINTLRVKQLLLKVISATVILLLTSFFTLNFNISASPLLILSALSLVILDYIVSTLSGIHDIPLYRAIVSFVAASIIIYMTQFIVSGFYISMITAIIASLMYAVIQYFLPNVRTAI